MINAAVPPLHAWLTDAYPEATVTGAIFLSALTTKTAVYVLIRGFPGTELLVWLGAVMALWGVVYAVLANDIRRLLAYHIISQVGYMVAGVGMGTAIALNGSASHAFTHILYKSLLFMGAGAVIHMTGRSKLTELGGIYRYMPITFLLYMVGAFSISAFPLFSGFVSKTMVVEAAAVDYRMWIWLMLSMASAGTFLHTGLKLPYFTFLGKDSGLRPKEAPWNMLLAMGDRRVLLRVHRRLPGLAVRLPADAGRLRRLHDRPRLLGAAAAAVHRPRVLPAAEAPGRRAEDQPRHRLVLPACDARCGPLAAAARGPGLERRTGSATRQPGSGGRRARPPPRARRHPRAHLAHRKHGALGRGDPRRLPAGLLSLSRSRPCHRRAVLTIVSG
jgi:hypothetical protein